MSEMTVNVYAFSLYPTQVYKSLKAFLEYKVLADPALLFMSYLQTIWL